MKNVIVYQMGKVASSTVYFTLKKHLNVLGQDCVVAPPHNGLDDSRPDSEVKLYHGHKLTDFSKTFKNRIKDSENIVISLVRDPISRNLSQMFESPKYGLNQRHSYQLTNEFTDFVVQKFTVDYGHTDMLHWFDNEIGKTFGIDIYEHDFDTEKGFLKVVKDKTTLYVIRVEDLDDVLLGFLKEELDLEVDEIVYDNITSTKTYNGELYKRVKNKLTLPQDIIEKVYEHKFTKKFYTEKEIEGFKEKWSKTEKI